MRSTIDDTLNDLPNVLLREGFQADKTRILRALGRAPRRRSNVLWVASAAAFLVAVVAIATAMHQIPVSKTNTTSKGAAASLTLGEFPAVEQKALEYVGQRTRLPVLAPTHLISGSGGQGNLSLTAVASPASYNVQISRTKTSLPLNSPKISEPPNNGLAANVGGYSGREFRSVALAEAGLSTSNGFFVRPPRSGLQKVSLGLGITGKAWIASPGNAVILWNQGGWTLEVNSEPLVALTPYARGLVEYLHTHPLPNYHGIAAIEDAGDGEHTLVCGRVGNDVYTVGDYHVARDAFAMTEAMRLLKR